MKKTYWYVSIGLMITAFAVLFVLRQPFVSDKVNSGNTAHAFMLTTINVWNEQGFFNNHGAAVQTWTKQGDLNMHYYERLADKKGRNYYISHPPFAFQLAAAFIFLFQLDANQLALQYLLLFLLFAGALLIAWIVNRELRNDQPSARITGFAAAILYVFIPVNLYAHTFHYFSEILGQFFMVLSIAAVVHYKYSGKPFLAQLLLGISVFLLSYTDWMGIPFVVGLLLVFHPLRKEACYRRMIRVSLIASFFAYALVFIQYVSISGFHNLYRALGIRFLERSGYFGSRYTDMQLDVMNPESWRLLFVQIHELLVGPGYLVLSVLVIYLLIRKQGKHLKNAPKLLWLALLVPLFYTAILFSASATHYVYTAKFAPLLAIAGGFAFGKIRDRFNKDIIVVPLVFFVVTLSAIPGFLQFKKHVPISTSADIILDKSAEFVRMNVASDEAVFIKPLDSFPESAIIYLSFFSNRNLCFANDTIEASGLASVNDQAHFVLIDFNTKGKPEVYRKQIE